MIKQLSKILKEIGVTRINEISKYDDLPIHVVQVIRPRAKHIKVDSGKGFTFEDSFTSAAVESIERYVAENIYNPTFTISVGQLPQHIQSLYCSRSHYPTSIKALKGVCLLTNNECFIPLRMCSYNVFDLFNSMPCVASGTTGLGAHLCFELSILSGIFEILERAAIASNSIIEFKLPNSLLVYQYISFILDKVPSIEINCFRTLPDFYVIEVRSTDTSVNGGFNAFGTGFSLKSALIDALGEAMQTWLMRIAGSRDDWSYSLTPLRSDTCNSIHLTKSSLANHFDLSALDDNDINTSKYNLKSYHTLIRYCKIHRIPLFAAKLDTDINISPITVSKVVMPSLVPLRQGPMLTGFPVLPV